MEMFKFLNLKFKQFLNGLKTISPKMDIHVYDISKFAFVYDLHPTSCVI